MDKGPVMTAIARTLPLAVVLALAACAGDRGPSNTAEVKDACAASYGPGTRGFDLCLRGNYPATSAGGGGY